MSEMHPDTRAAVVAALRTELATDPTGRGYAGKTAAEIAALLAAPVQAAVPEPQPKAFKWGDARGIAQAHGCWPMIVLRARGTPAMPPQTAQDGAILAAINAVSAEREQIINAADPGEWGAFSAGVQAFAAVGDLTEAAAAAILALGTYQPPTPPDEPARWGVVIDGISAAPTPPDPVGLDARGEPVFHPGNAGPPNGPTLDLIEEALANGG